MRTWMALATAGTTERGLARTLLLPALLLCLAAPATLWIALAPAEEATLPPDPPDPPPLPRQPLAAPSAGGEGVEQPAPGAEVAAPPPTRTAAGPRLEGQRPRAGVRRTTATLSVPATLALLSRTRAWTRHLEAWLTLPPAKDTTERGARRAEVWAVTTDPVVRQNTIFLAALTEPWEEVRPWLEALRTGSDADDAEDALCALAFSGDPGAIGAFRALARSPSGAAVHRLVDDPDAHDALAAHGTSEARAALRAWRSIEALDATPYFEMVGYLASRWRGDATTLGWQARSVSPADQEALLQAWLARYPGHPGSDNMAVRLGRLRYAAGDEVGAARWFARALALPDQVEAWRAAGRLVALCETVLAPAQLLSLAQEEWPEAAARTIFLYANARRLAAGTGFDAACRALEDLAAREPDLVLSVAWRNRWAGPAPEGLASGVAPLPADDALWRSDGRWVPWPVPAPGGPGGQYGATSFPGVWGRPWRAAERLDPPRDPVVLDRTRLANQVRAWATLAELERRAARARGPARADLLYKQAAVLYHDRDVLFPCYEEHTWSFRGTLRRLEPPGTPDASDRERERLERFGAESFAWERALALFERIEREHHEYAALDKVLFSAGMCWKRLVDYRPRSEWAARDRDDPQDAAVVAVRRCVACFERLAHEHPQSSLADDAARAAAWWRRSRPEAFR